MAHFNRGTYGCNLERLSDIRPRQHPSGVEDGRPRRGLKRGDLKITFHGERLHGSFALIRMKFARDSSSSSKPQWLLIKHRDDFVTEEDVVVANMSS